MYGEPPAGRQLGQTVFEARGLSRRGEFADVSFQVRAGEIVGFSGLVGSGRTELSRAIFGSEPPDAGEMFLRGKKVAMRSPRQAIRAGIGYLTEDRKAHGLYLDFTIRDNVVANHLSDFSGSLLGFLRGPRMEEFARGRIKDFKIVAQGPGQVVNNLSGGNQQKVLLSAWFGIQPRFLIADEPTRGVDVGAKSDIYRLLRSLAAEGIAIMLISSDLPEIIGISDRVYVMRDGSIVGELPREQAREETIISLATGLQISRSKECVE
jgi:ABC-type sugar transport system ATPase subunit